MVEGKMSPDGPTEERVVWRERFQGQHFDFRSKIILTRFDGCEFVKCTLLIDHETGQLAFTGCVFKDSNIDKLEEDEERGLYVRDNFFDDAIVRVMQRAEIQPMIFEYGGPRIYTYEKFLQVVAHEAGPKPILVPIPFAAARTGMDRRDVPESTLHS